MMAGKIISRMEACEYCGADLGHARTGRPRRFCSTRCRVAYNRAMKRHAEACVDAALAGQPEPARDFGQPIRFTSYEVDEAGNATKLSRPGPAG